ncbi:MAG: hypothetical protein H7144_17030 [Burkholderiales bacterium]|nr:hypothetical protein [Phycisphaerae bacterium]
MTAKSEVEMGDPRPQADQFPARPFKPQKAALVVTLLVFVVWMAYLTTVYLHQVSPVRPV